MANSLVSDRYIQLAPAYTGTGPTLPDGANIPLNRTAAPAELDDIYSALNQLSVALGPAGANKPGANGKGALSTLLDVVGGEPEGQRFGPRPEHHRALPRRADAGQRPNGPVRDGQEPAGVQPGAGRAATARCGTSPPSWRRCPATSPNERADLGAALHNLAVALHAVAGFVHDNAAKAHKDITGLEAITGVLNKDSAAVNEIAGRRRRSPSPTWCTPTRRAPGRSAPAATCPRSPTRPDLRRTQAAQPAVRHAARLAHEPDRLDLQQRRVGPARRPAVDTRTERRPARRPSRVPREFMMKPTVRIAALLAAAAVALSGCGFHGLYCSQPARWRRPGQPPDEPDRRVR